MILFRQRPPQMPGMIGASAPPATITSTSPLSIMRERVADGVVPRGAAGAQRDGVPHDAELLGDLARAGAAVAIDQRKRPHSLVARARHSPGPPSPPSRCCWRRFLPRSPRGRRSILPKSRLRILQRPAAPRPRRSGGIDRAAAPLFGSMYSRGIEFIDLRGHDAWANAGVEARHPACRRCPLRGCCARNSAVSRHWRR